MIPYDCVCVCMFICMLCVSLDVEEILARGAESGPTVVRRMYAHCLSYCSHVVQPGAGL